MRRPSAPWAYGANRSRTAKAKTGAPMNASGRPRGRHGALAGEETARGPAPPSTPTALAAYIVPAEPRQSRSIGLRLLARRVLLPVGLAGVLALGGCGGSSNTARNATSAFTVAAAPQTAPRPAAPRAPGTSSTAASRAALKVFAACLRRHGVKGSEPSTSATGAPAPAGGTVAASPAFRAASRACTPLLRAALARSAGAHGPASGATRRASPAAAPRPRPRKPPASITRAMRRFTACMRAHGVAGFPEPVGESFDLTDLHIDTAAAPYRSAEAACDALLQAIDPGH